MTVRDANRLSPRMPAASRLILGVVLVAGVAAYATHLHGAFFWDDKVYLLQNPRLVRGAPLSAVLLTPIGQVYRPVSTATFWLQVQLHGFSMAGFRLAQLALHLACVGAVFGWSRARLGAPAGLYGALGAAAVLLVHPAATEAVMFINARHDLLGALFVLVALLVLGPSGSTKRAAHGFGLGEAGSLRRGLVAGVCTLLAVGCKESYVVAAPLLAAQALVSAPASAPRAAIPRRLAVAAGPALVGIALVFLLRRAIGVSTSSAVALPLGSLGRAYAGLLLHHLEPFVTFGDAPSVERYVPPSALVTTLTLATAAAAWGALAWRAFRGGAVARTAWLGANVLLLGLLPSIAAIPSTGQHANRYGYFALAGFAVMSGAATVPVSSWVAGRTQLLARVSAATAVVALLTFALETFARAGEWRDGLTLFGADVERLPQDSRANYHFGVEVVDARGCAEALPYFERAAAEEPTWARPFRNFAGCELRLGRPDLALAPATRAVALEPFEPAHRRNLAAALAGTGQLEAARAELAEAARLASGGAR